MSVSLYCYNPIRFSSFEKQDIKTFNELYKIINFGVAFIDRTEIIKTPVRTAIPLQLKLPAYDSTFNMSYEECCQARVRKILKKQEELDVPINLLYSGGIDSSLILVSFIKELGMTEAEKRIQIMLHTESIEENPWMWHRILRRSNFKMIASEEMSNNWNKEKLIVGGEFNDQLMGSEMIRKLCEWKSDRILHQLWTETLMTEFHLYMNLSKEDAEHWTKVFLEHVKRAPCAVETVYEWWWWINFTCKWSSIYFRLLMHVKNKALVTQEYLDNYYFQFYGDENFQKWSMVNRTHKIKDSWLSYKWHSKELIAEVCGEEYKSKIKRGSLWRLLSYTIGAEAIDQNYNFIEKVKPIDWYNSNNSFII